MSAHDLRLMVTATEILQRVPGFSRSRAYVTYLSSCCRAVATLVRKPADVDPPAPTESLKRDAFNTDDPFAVFNDFPFEDKINNGLKDNTANDGNKINKTDDGETYSDKNSDSERLNELLARGQSWPANSLPTDPLSLTSSQSDPFSTPSWTRNFDFANITNSGNLTNWIYRADNEVQQPWPSVSTTPIQQYQQPLPLPQQQLDNQGGWPQQPQQHLGQGGKQPQQQWPQEMGMGFLMSEDGGSSWTDSWLN